MSYFFGVVNLIDHNKCVYLLEELIDFYSVSALKQLVFFNENTVLNDTSLIKAIKYQQRLVEILEKNIDETSNLTEYLKIADELCHLGDLFDNGNKKRNKYESFKTACDFLNNLIIEIIKGRFSQSDCEHLYVYSKYLKCVKKKGESELRLGYTSLSLKSLTGGIAFVEKYCSNYKNTIELQRCVSALYNRLGNLMRSLNDDMGSKKYYLEVRRNEFSLKDFIATLFSRFNIKLDVNQTYESIMQECPKFLNVALVEEVKRLGRENCYLVTNGQLSLQEDKIKRCGVASLFQEIYVVPGMKEDSVKKICDKNKEEEVIFFDDRQYFLDDIADCPNLKTILYDINKNTPIVF